MDDINLERGELFSDGARGMYIPQHFAETVKRDMVTGISDDDFAILEAGPEHELYWEAWSDALDNAVLTHPTMGECRLWQDGDLWVYVVADQSE